MTKTLEEVHDEVKRLFYLGKCETVMALLSDAHEFADNIISLIREGKDEGTESEAHLKRLMGIIRAAFEEIDKCIEDNTKPSDSFISAWHMLCVKLEAAAKAELRPDKLEMAFLPYKASMWDSFESVWLAAKDDPDCDAYVVPVPYYEVLPDGGLGKEHYEVEDYPDYVSVTDWLAYDIEKRRPDVVFIHYPYDEMTRNARIHPDFYSSRICGFCDLLVYIPYFVNSGIDEPEYFGILPGIVLADLVILQTEANRQAYIKHFTKYDRINGWNGRYGRAEEKFVVLGSPKYDKVIKSKLEDFTIPAVWKRLIKKVDGTRKKVVLYNTHMFALIEGGDKYLDKLRYVLNTFRTFEDALLLWRPHPSTELNLRVTAPGLLARYRSITAEYQREGWGIYDDTPDLHRAILLSSCYYGDPSSIAQMFQYAGKPVFIQSLDILPMNVNEENLEAENGNIGEWNGCMIHEGPLSITLKGMLEAVTSPKEPEWLAKRLDIQSRCVQNELGVPADKAGGAIYKYCKSALQH